MSVTYYYGGPDFDTIDFQAPPLIGFFAFFFVFLLTTVSFLRERTAGTLERLMVTPTTRAELVLGYMVGFGLLSGAGIGFAYASATPPAVKWFHAGRTGMIAGIVVAGFGLASVYAAPLAKWLIANYGVPTMSFTLGLAFLAVVIGLAQFLVAPPKGYVPPGSQPKAAPGPSRWPCPR